MDATGFFLEITLLDLLYFQANMLPTSPEEIVDDMLAQVHSARTSKDLIVLRPFA